MHDARRIHEEDIAGNQRIGEYGAALLPAGARVLTHCNAGSLATGGYGTALGVIRAAWAAGRARATSTQPRRGRCCRAPASRPGSWRSEGIPFTLIPDSAAGSIMRRGLIDAVVVGADRIAANGDVANKIGTYQLAVLAHENGIPFYVAAPTSTIDLSLVQRRPTSRSRSARRTRSRPSGAQADRARGRRRRQPGVRRDAEHLRHRDHHREWRRARPVRGEPAQRLRPGRLQRVAELDPSRAVIGGSGFYQMDGLDRRRARCASTRPSARPATQSRSGTLDGQRVAFLPRHGVGHRILPSASCRRAPTSGR